MTNKFLTSEACHWAEYLNLLPHEMPYAVKNMLKRVRPPFTRFAGAVQDKRNFYQAENMKIHDVFTSEAFEAMMAILEKVHIIGFDCENTLNNNDLALIQVAARDDAFLIDASPKTKISKKHFEELATLFNNKNILKIGRKFFLSQVSYSRFSVIHPLNLCVFHSLLSGFATRNDINEMKERMPTISRMNVVDMKTVFENLIANSYQFPKAPPDGKKWTPSLKNFAHAILLNPLRKDEQISDWENRPLRQLISCMTQI